MSTMKITMLACLKLLQSRILKRFFCLETGGKEMPRVRIELTTFRSLCCDWLWDWRATYCATEAMTDVLLHTTIYNGLHWTKLMIWPIYKNSHYNLHVKIPSHKARMLFYFIYFNFSAPNSQFPCGLVVRIPRSHRGGRGSIPRMGRFLSNLAFERNCWK